MKHYCERADELNNKANRLLRISDACISDACRVLFGTIIPAIILMLLPYSEFSDYLLSYMFLCVSTTIMLFMLSAMILRLIAKRYTVKASRIISHIENQSKE